MSRPHSSYFQDKLLATSVVTNSVEASLDFYVNGLGYQVLSESSLSKNQQISFGKHLKRCILVGHDRNCTIRLLESNIPLPKNRIDARPYDIGLCVMEAGAADVDLVYERLLRNRIGCITPPLSFSVTGPEPLGYVVMKAVGVYGPSGEQMFITQITEREGGIPLWEQRKDINVFPPGNVVISLKDRSTQQFYEEFLYLFPETDLPLDQAKAFELMGGPSSMTFDMCLMGNGNYKTGMEQHVYGSYNPEFDFKMYPCDFKKAGLASACWAGHDLDNLHKRLKESSAKVTSRHPLPVRDNPTPDGLVYRGPAGEIIELVS